MGQPKLRRSESGRRCKGNGDGGTDNRAEHVPAIDRFEQ